MNALYLHFTKAVEKARTRLANTSDTLAVEPYFFVRDNAQFVQIRYSDVLYIKAQDNFVEIVTKQHTYLPALFMAKLEEKLKSDVFLRVHRSYLVHRDAIASIAKNDIILTNGQTIPIGDQYRNKINAKHIEGYIVAR